MTIIKPVKAWALIKEDKKIDPMFVFVDKDVRLFAGESIIRVKITPDGEEIKNTRGKAKGRTVAVK